MKINHFNNLERKIRDQKHRHVFISYVRENKKQVDRLCRDLESHGVKVWLDRKSIKPGARWKDAIREAIRHGDFFIACFSKEYASRQKNFMNEELTVAIDELRQFATDREWFMPVLLSECDLPARSIGAGETLLDINWVPLYEDWQIGIQKILSVIKPIPPRIQNLIDLLRSEDSRLRGVAAVELGKIGSEAKAALPALIEALKDEDQIVRRSATKALPNIGPAAVMALIEALNSEEQNVRALAADGLRDLGPEAIVAVPTLIEALKEENKWVHGFAAAALGEIGPEAVPALIEALNSKFLRVRAGAAEALGYIGAEAKAVVPALIEALKDEMIIVSAGAVEALININTPAARKALEEYLQQFK